jgi:hypothetical protein
MIKPTDGDRWAVILFKNSTRRAAHSGDRDFAARQNPF